MKQRVGFYVGTLYEPQPYKECIDGTRVKQAMIKATFLTTLDAY